MQWRSQPDNLVMLYKFKSSFTSLEIDSLYGIQTQKNLHLHDQMLGWLRYSAYVEGYVAHFIAFLCFLFAYACAYVASKNQALFLLCYFLELMVCKNNQLLKK